MIVVRQEMPHIEAEGLRGVHVGHPEHATRCGDPRLLLARLLVRSLQHLLHAGRGRKAAPAQPAARHEMAHGSERRLAWAGGWAALRPRSRALSLCREENEPTGPR